VPLVQLLFQLFKDAACIVLQFVGMFVDAVFYVDFGDVEWFGDFDRCSQKKGFTIVIQT